MWKDQIYSGIDKDPDKKFKKSKIGIKKSG